MNLLNKLTIKNLLLNKRRTIVTIIGIMLSVALITAVASVYSSGLESLKRFEIQEVGNYHMIFYNVDSNNVDEIKNYRGIENVSLTKSLGYSKIDSQNEGKPYAHVVGYDKNTMSNLSINLIEGRLPENENEVVIPTHLKTNGRLKLNVGDDITLDLGTRSYQGNELNQQNEYVEGEVLTVNSKKTYKIVGIAERPANKVEPFMAPGYSFITLVSSDSFNGKVDVYTKISKKYLKDYLKIYANIEGIEERAAELSVSTNKLSKEENEYIEKEFSKVKYPLSDLNIYLIQLETDPIGLSSMGGLIYAVAVVITIIVVTSVFCIKNSFDISITEKIKQYGMLRSIGSTKKQIRRNVFYEATILGIIGIPLGICLGLLAAYILMLISNYYLVDMMASNVKLIFSTSYLAILISIVLSIITIYLSAFRSSRKASKVSPIDSIRNSADIKINNKKIKCPGYIKKIFGVGGEISYKNLKRNKRKYRTTIISIILSVSVFIALFSFMNVAFEEVEKEIKLGDYNIFVSIRSNVDYNKAREITNLDTVEDYSIVRSEQLEIDRSYLSKEYVDFSEDTNAESPVLISMMVLGDQQYKKYIQSLGLKYEDVKDKGILVNTIRVLDGTNSKTLNHLNVKAGDIIHGKTSLAKNPKNYDLNIVTITDKNGFGIATSYEAYAIISDEVYNKNFETSHINVYVKSSDPDKLQDEIEQLFVGEEIGISNSNEDYRMTHNLFTLVGIFLYGFIIVISLIGITNIFNTITTTMELRKQEFAMLVSVGMTKNEFNRMIRLESLFMGLKALVIGIPIGCVLSILINKFLSDGPIFKLPLMAIGISIVVVFILLFVIMSYSIHKIRKQNTIEVIRNENI